MYSLFLVLAVAAVILSPLALELWLTMHENRLERRRFNKAVKAQRSRLAWASRLQP